MVPRTRIGRSREGLFWGWGGGRSYTDGSSQGPGQEHRRQAGQPSAPGELQGRATGCAASLAALTGLASPINAALICTNTCFQPTVCL